MKYILFFSLSMLQAQASAADLVCRLAHLKIAYVNRIVNEAEQLKKIADIHFNGVAEPLLAADIMSRLFSLIQDGGWARQSQLISEVDLPDFPIKAILTLAELEKKGFILRTVDQHKSEDKMIALTELGYNRSLAMLTAFGDVQIPERK